MARLTREQHLFEPGRKRILALDGGGIRGMISLGVLKQIETLLAQRAPDKDAFRLCHYFDLIVGTSTGSIIATALALGMSVDRVRQLYEEMSGILFPSTGVKGIFKFRRDAKRLDEVLSAEFGERKFESDDLQTGLMICAKRIDTDSAWVLTNNPKSKFWVSTDGAFMSNKDYLLKTIVRASAAAPTFFEPVLIDITEENSQGFEPQIGAFVDGAISGHNSPALQALMTATLPSYKLGWTTGVDNLLLISVGTGMRRNRFQVRKFIKKAPADQAVEALKGLINATVMNNLAVLQALSEPNRAWPINAEINGLEGEYLATAPMMRFQRFDASLEDAAVVEALNLSNKGKGFQTRVVRGLCQMDNGFKKNVGYCYALGLAAGRSAVDADFPAEFNVPG